MIFGTRPEHLSLVSGGRHPGQVVVVEPTGADTFVSVPPPGQRGCRWCSANATTFAPGSHHPPAARSAAGPTCSTRNPADGSRPEATFNPGDMHVRQEPSHQFLESSAGVAAAATAGHRRAVDAARGAGAEPRLQARRRAPSCACCAGSAVQGDEDAFMANINEVQRQDRHRGARRQRRLGRRGAPRPPVAANIGSGPDIIIGWFDDPHQRIPTS